MADIQGFIQEAKAQGYSDQDIQTYLSQNGLGQSTPNPTPILQPTQTTQPIVQTPPTVTASSTGNNPLGALADYLPILGGVGGGIIGAVGGPIGAIAGAGFGAGLGAEGKQWLQGNPGNPLSVLTGLQLPGAENTDVRNNQAVNAGGEAVGLGLSGLVGGLFKKEGSALSTGALNLTKNQMNKYAVEHGGETVAETLAKNKLTGANPEAITEAIAPLNKQFGDIINGSDFTVTKDAVEKALAAAKDKILSAPTTANKALAESLQAEYDSAIKPLFDENGNVLGSQINKMKQAYDAATSPMAFRNDPIGYNLNRTIGSTLRDALQSSPGGEALKGLGITLNKLIDLQGMGLLRQGVGGTTKSITRALVGGGIGSLFGQNPLLGAGAAEVAGKALENPLIAGILSKGATGVGNAITSPIGAGITGAAGAASSGALNNALFPNVNGNKDTNQSTNDQNSNQVTPPTNSITPSNKSVMTPSSGGLTVTRDDQGHYQLPDASSVQTEIPGQPYPIKNQIADLKRAGSNPFAYDQISKAATANQEYVNQYLQTHQLDQTQQDFIRQAPALNDQYNNLRDLINTSAGKNIFQAVLNDSPLVQYVKSQTDPNGAYAQMLTALNSLRGQAVKQQGVNRLTQYEVMTLSGLPNANDTAKTAIAKIDRLQGFLADQYTRWLPQYGLTLAAQNNAPQMTQTGGLQGATPALNSALGVPPGVIKGVQ